MSKSRCFYYFYDQRMNLPCYCKRAITTRVYNDCSPTHMIINDFYESYVITKRSRFSCINPHQKNGVCRNRRQAFMVNFKNSRFDVMQLCIFQIKKHRFKNQCLFDFDQSKSLPFEAMTFLYQ